VAGWEIPKTAGFQSFLAGKMNKQNGGFMWISQHATFDYQQVTIVVTIQHSD